MLTIKNEGPAGLDFSELRVESARDCPEPALRMELIAFTPSEEWWCRSRPTEGNIVLSADSVRALRDQLDAWLEQNAPPTPNSVVSGSLV